VNTLLAFGEAATAQGGARDAVVEAQGGSSGSVRRRGQGRRRALVGSTGRGRRQTLGMETTGRWAAAARVGWGDGGGGTE
jgi:hypothetical protein